MKKKSVKKKTSKKSSKKGSSKKKKQTLGVPYKKHKPQVSKSSPEWKPNPDPVGRPTEYEPIFAGMLVEHMGTGLSFESFAGVVLVSKTSLMRWVKEHIEFRTAKEIGREICRLWWEKTGIDGLHCTQFGKNLNANLWRLNVQARFKDEWKVEAKIEGNMTIEHDIKKLRQMPLEDVIKIGKQAVEYLEAEFEEN